MFGEGLGGYYTNNWCFPPEIVGHEVSYGTAVNGLIETDFTAMDHISLPTSSMMLPGMSTQQPPRAQQPQQHQQRLGDQPSPEVLAAATALSRSSGTQFDMMFSPTQEAAPAVNHAVGHAQHHGYGATVGEVNQLHSSHNPLSRLYNTLDGNQSYSRRARQPMEEMRFGSDTGFNRVNFVPQSAKDTTEAISANQLATLGCLERNISAAPTRATSPISWVPPSPNGRRSSLLSPVRLKTASHNPLTPDELENDDSARPRKRRKSTKTGDPIVEDDNRRKPSLPPGAQANLPGTSSLPVRRTSTTPVPRRHRPSGPLTPEAEAATAASGGGKRRRKSAAAMAAAMNSSKMAMSKTPRENLSEEQKRENHIKSEQKRRNIIKSGFNDLVAVVPALKGGGYSKAAMLNLTADWLTDVIEGNQRLKSMMRQGEGMAVMV